MIFPLPVFRACLIIGGLDGRIGQRRDATRAPIQARNGWRPSGRVLVTPPYHLGDGQNLSKLWGPPQASPFRRIVKARGLRVRVPRHTLRDLDTAAIRQVIGNPRGAEGMAPYRRLNTRRLSTAADHAPSVYPRHGTVRQFLCPAACRCPVACRAEQIDSKAIDSRKALPKKLFNYSLINFEIAD